MISKLEVMIMNCEVFPHKYICNQLILFIICDLLMYSRKIKVYDHAKYGVKETQSN